LALAALALVLFGAYDSYPVKYHTIYFLPKSFDKKRKKLHKIFISPKFKNNIFIRSYLLPTFKTYGLSLPRVLQKVCTALENILITV